METECYICEESLIVRNYLDSVPVWNKKRETYLGQSHKKCFYFKEKENAELSLKRLEEKEEHVNCIFCEKPLVKQNYRATAKDHCHITGTYRGAARNACNLKMKIKPKTIQIPVLFHNLRCYNAHHLMQAMSDLQKEVKCVVNNMEK